MRRTTVKLLTLCTFVIGLLSLSTHAEAGRKTVVSVGIVSDGGDLSKDPLLVNILEQAKSLAGADVELRFPKDKQLDGEFDSVKIRAHLDTLLADPSVTIVLAYGIVVGNMAGTESKLPKPVLVPFVIDRKLQKLPFALGKSGRTNLSYIEFPWSIPRDLEVFREVASATSMTFLIDQYILDAIPGLSAQAKAIALENQVDMSVLGVADSADAVLQALPTETKAVYLAPLFILTKAEHAKLQKGLTARRIATFSIQGEPDVLAGALVGRRPLKSMEKIARRVALDIVRIAGGARPESLRVSLRLPERLMINVKTARAIRLSPSWRVLTEAELVGTDSRKTGRKVDLFSVIREALDGNLNVQALKLATEAGGARVRSARASLLPQISGESTAQGIDSDRANFAPQYTWNGKISATQVLWSEKAWAGLAVEKLTLKSRKQELKTGQLDVVGNVANAYLNVVRAKTSMRIQHQNLKTTRANLETARTQFEAGATSKADVYRWESQIADARRVLINASASRNIAEISLQKILNRPPEEPFETSDELASPQAIALLQGIDKYLSDPWTFRLFRRFLIEEATRNSPELQQLDTAIAVQERLETSAKRALYSPTVSLTGSVSHRFWGGGTGSGPAAPGIPDGTDWFAGLTLSVPLYEGGRYAEISRNTKEILRLRAQRQDLVNSVSQRTAASLHQLGASYAGISLSRESSNAAKKNYDLVAVAYAQGAVRILDLIDAQNAWFSSDSRAADSVYAFLIDWINVQRALGKFITLMDESERKDLIVRVNTYIANEKKRDSAR